jgi:hypothetical protein
MKIQNILEESEVQRAFPMVVASRKDRRTHWMTSPAAVKKKEGFATTEMATPRQRTPQVEFRKIF